MNPETICQRLNDKPLRVVPGVQGVHSVLLVPSALKPAVQMVHSLNPNKTVSTSEESREEITVYGSNMSRITGSAARLATRFNCRAGFTWLALALRRIFHKKVKNTLENEESEDLAEQNPGHRARSWTRHLYATPNQPHRSRT